MDCEYDRYRIYKAGKIDAKTQVCVICKKPHIEHRSEPDGDNDEKGIPIRIVKWTFGNTTRLWIINTSDCLLQRQWKYEDLRWSIGYGIGVKASCLTLMKKDLTPLNDQNFVQDGEIIVKADARKYEESLPMFDKCVVC